jgi:zinc transport system substrate-binding protein
MSVREILSRSKLFLSAIVAVLVGSVVFVSCVGSGYSERNALVVSIEPLKYIVEEIVGDDFRVNVLVPPGASPETYEPTPLQIKAAEDAQLVFSTGLIDFERVMLGRLPSPERLVDLSAGIDLVESAHVHEGGREHAGADPHTWIAPRVLAKMAATAYGRLHELYPDSLSYTTNYERFAGRLAELDSLVAQRLTDLPTRSFMIFHPGLTYFARDYGLRQIALESDGKEPSVRQLADILKLADSENITKIFYQREFPRRIVEVAAAEIGATPFEIDILGHNVEDNILKITELIAK